MIAFFLNFGMVLETRMKLCVAEPDFLEIFFAQMLGKWAKSRVFLIYWKIWSLIFTEFVL